MSERALFEPEPTSRPPVLAIREAVAGYAPGDPERGAAYVEVVIDGLALADPRPYTYHVPLPWRGKLLPGMAVLVPFGPRRGVPGYITGLSNDPPDDHAARDLEDVVAGDALPPELQALLLWLSDYYLAPLSSVLTTAMPRGTLTRVQRWARLAVSLETFTELARGWTGPMAQLAAIMIAGGGEAPLTRLQTAVKKSGAVLGTWRQKDLVRYHSAFVPPDRKAKTALHVVALEAPTEALSARQMEILGALMAHGGCWPLAALIKSTRASDSVFKTLARKGAVDIRLMPVRRSAVGQSNGERLPTLTPHQAQVLGEIDGAIGTSTTFLLHGCTGSGKTEVYLRAIAKVLDRDEGAIVLVPEIALTPQTVRRFQARFGDTVAVLHSHLSDGERFDEWQRIRAGDARVVIGARSAVFAPVPDLGLIIIDEEHESSYKQDKSPRYHARTVAEQRARLEGICLILGSATPCLESYAAARDGRFHLLEMPDRVESRPMPPVTVIDMCKELKQGNRSMFSRDLQTALKGAFTRGEQAILLMNRRGYSSFVFCRGCGYVCRCTRCSVAMTFHQSPDSLRCHYCDARGMVPTICPQCQSVDIRHFGAGTQQVEEAMARLIPEARIVRLDRDTTSRRGSHQVMLDAFGRGDYDILIGTQMVAKGLDFPRVTVVGVMAADGALHLPDFRASERTFQLLTQVAGRAGRGDLTSEVVVQTYSAEHPAIVAAQTHDYIGFFDAELPDRCELGFPPFIQVANVIVAGPDPVRTLAAATHFAEHLGNQPCMQVFGPHDAPLAILRGLHRVQVFIKISDMDLARPVIRHALSASQQPGIRLSVDLDAYNLL